MFTLAIVLMIILGLLLIASVLIQPGKGDMATSMSGFGNQLGTMFGSRRASDLLTKITIVLGATIMVIALLANKFLLRPADLTRDPATVNAAKPIIPPSTPVKQTAPAQQSSPAEQQTQPAAQPETQPKKP
ncbi:MAG: preprotein translocase subunit SecG [Bacteroidota bacterium]